MIRAILTILGCACMALVLCEVAGVVFLWQRGSLSDYNVREIRLLLSGELQPEADPEPVKAESATVSFEAVQTARALRVLELQARESSLGVLHRQVLDEQKRIQEMQDRFRAEQEAFDKRLQELETEIAAAGAEQARGVLLALPPAQAADKLMTVTLGEALRLAKGLPEKSIAKILKELTGTKEKLERAQQLFRAIYQGDPQQSLVDEAQARLTPTDTATP